MDLLTRIAAAPPDEPSVDEAPTDDAFSRSLLDASADCIKVMSLGGELEYMNVNGLCLMEIDDFDALRGRRWTELWPVEHHGDIEAALTQARGGAVARFCADCPTGKGTLKSWEVVVSPVLDASGRPERLVSVSRDITERVRTETENALLARELAHRIKNMFAVVDGVVALSARAAPEARGFSTALRNRLRALGRAVAYVTPPELAGPAGEAHTLHGLLHVLLEPYGHDGGAGSRVVIAGDDIVVGPAAVTPLALIANELATNAMKYGALQAPGGRVDVSTRSKGGRLELVWSEHGAGVPAPRALGGGEGFGTTLVDNAVARQLGGSLSREWSADGLVVRIGLPLGRLAR